MKILDINEIYKIITDILYNCVLNLQKYSVQIQADSREKT